MKLLLALLGIAGTSLILPGSGDPTALSDESLPLAPKVATEPVATDADDPAIWIHPTDPGRSLVIGTDKIEKTGGIWVFSLSGKTVQSIGSIDRPNNVDVEYGFKLGGETVDLAVATERGVKALRVFAIDRSSGKLSDVTGRTAVFKDRQGEAAAPMGIGLFKRPSDGAVFAIVGSKTGPTTGYLHQYRLIEDQGKVSLDFVRSFGSFSGEGEIEAIVVDDALGHVYCADEGAGLRKYHADPNAKNAAAELALFATSGYSGDREGLAILETSPGKGWILSADQVEGGSAIMVYRREGDGSSPHKHTLVARVEVESDETDGLDATAKPLGNGFPRGLVVAMNSKGRNFHLFDPGSILDRIKALVKESRAAEPARAALCFERGGR